MTHATSHFCRGSVFVWALVVANALSCSGERADVGSPGVSASQDAGQNAPSREAELRDTSWVQLGFYPGVGDEFLQAIAELTTMECCEYALDDETFAMSTCVHSLFGFYAPRMQWLACVAREAQASVEISDYVAALGDYIVETDACYRREACRIRDCAELPEPEPPAALEQCPDRSTELCPDGNGFSNGVDCNGVNDCSDGYDERNCPPSPDGFACGDGGLVPWASLCDGTPDCGNRVDETTCF